MCGKIHESVAKLMRDTSEDGGIGSRMDRPARFTKRAALRLVMGVMEGEMEGRVEGRSGRRDSGEIPVGKGRWVSCPRVLFFFSIPLAIVVNAGHPSLHCTPEEYPGRGGAFARV